MIEINLFDTTFTHQACSVALQTPQSMRYVRGQMDWPGITVFVDGELYSPVVDDVRSRFKIGWLHEARALHPENYERISQVMHKFDAVMSHDAALLALGAPFIKTIRGGSWVSLDQWGMYPKSKNVSMILSEKIQLEGHQLRHAIAAAGLPIDVFGPTPFLGGNKALVYKEYCFAVVVEACKEENFFSEHLIDALAYGCVPIYWGCPNIASYFDPAGLMLIDRLSDLPFLLEANLMHDYWRRAPALIVNQTLARFYTITEDWQIEHCLRPFVEALSC